MASLPSFQTLCIILYLQISTIQSFIKSTKIKPSLLPSLPAHDISVTSGPGASVIADLWSITNVQSQGSDLQIQLGSSWGFNPSYISTIELYIQGNTSNETYNDDGEILFVFSVGDQYFTEMVSLDYRKTAYKECPDKGTPLITRDVTEMINGEKPDRYYRYCKNNISQENHGTDYWINAGSTSYKEPVEWPMFMQIINDPINHTVTYNWGDAANNYAIKVFSYYTSSYPTDQGLNVYIAAENLNEDFYIFSIDVTYHYTATPTPTSNPTIAPTTMNPTAIPTIAPITNDPTTENPTTATPTTSNPTIPPTTANPTTSIPTTNPIKTPTIAPITSVPTTEMPTTAHPATSTPTGNPTNKPTVTPTYKPTLSPSYKPTISPSINTTATSTIAPNATNLTAIPTEYKSTIAPITSDSTADSVTLPITSNVTTTNPTTSKPTFNTSVIPLNSSFPSVPASYSPTLRPVLIVMDATTDVPTKEVDAAPVLESTNNIVQDQVAHSPASPIFYVIIASSVTAAVCLIFGCFIVVCIVRKYSKQHNDHQLSAVPSNSHPLKQNVCQSSEAHNNSVDDDSNESMDDHSNEENAIEMERLSVHQHVLLTKRVLNKSNDFEGQ